MALQHGSQGKAVADVQAALKRRGFGIGDGSSRCLRGGHGERRAIVPDSAQV